MWVRGSRTHTLSSRQLDREATLVGVELDHAQAHLVTRRLLGSGYRAGSLPVTMDADRRTTIRRST